MKKYSILLGDKEIPYILKKSSRKTVGITISQNGEIVISSPHRVSEAAIQDVLKKKSAWILQKLEKFESMNQKSAYIFAQGGYLLFKGSEYKLNFVSSPNAAKPKVAVEGKSLSLYYRDIDNVEKMKDELKLWYVEQFKAAISERIPFFSKKLGVNPCKITIREQKTRWGSCSSKGNINLNWRLIMAPDQVLDYVVIHELCHLKQMNHSAAFWSLVAGSFPSYQLCRKWLKENGSRMIY